MDHASHDERPKSDESEKGGARLCLDNGNELAINVTIKRGEQKYNRLGWKRLTICIIVEAIALGSLSIPSAFAVLGLVPGVIITVGLGFIAIYTSYLIGLVKLKYPYVAHYTNAGRVGKELAGFMFAALLILSTGSHALTGSIAISTIANTNTCAVAWSVVSTVVLFFLALPPSFAEFAILGYIDFVSILLAIGITIVATRVSASDTAGGLVAVD
ncbi:hypothetical protein D0859_01712 [Hortaea werneckii]|uniref:Amino acid transporter transmembrane domain-containing protein n=1 Tax=Hortaea werneckii TaxID=91943 RepID=A0A3M7J988_HORWE|nr:hypothetical protein D0859_01712 [Hortaea werneckii]